MIPLFDDNPHRRTPVVVVVFILANAAVLLVELAQPTERALLEFVHTWGLVPAALWHDPDPRVWFTPLTSMFLHGGWMHLLGNCWFLWVFGNNVEDRLGHARFVVFYVFSGLGAAALQVGVGPASLVPMVGASGAISGVLGAYIRYYPKAPVYTLVPVPFAPILPIPAFIFIAIWFGCSSGAVSVRSSPPMCRVASPGGRMWAASSPAGGWQGRFVRVGLVEGTRRRSAKHLAY